MTVDRVLEHCRDKDRGIIIRWSVRRNPELDRFVRSPCDVAFGRKDPIPGADGSVAADRLQGRMCPDEMQQHLLVGFGWNRLSLCTITWSRYVSGHSRPFFVTTDSIQMFYLKVGRILVSNLSCRKRQLYQLSQNHCPKCKKVGIQFYSCCRYIWFSRYLKAIKCLRCVNECRRCSRSQQ